MSQVDYLAMSDEDWLKSAIPQSTTAPEGDVSAAETNTNTDPVVVDPIDPTTEKVNKDQTQGNPETVGATDADSTTGTPTEQPNDATSATDTQAEIDYKAAYEKLTKPFKANGREVHIKDVDDAIQLMQMGANYTKKMAALKPNLKLMKLLESNGLMDEEKISFLIDLQAKNPAAISRLVKESGVDPMDLDEDKAKEYTPTVRRVNDQELELDQVLEEIQDSPMYQKTVQVVAHEWDVQSKQVIAQSPQLLKVINQHMESGVFDIIKTELDSERMFGRLNGVSDLEAYRQIGDRIQERGGFNHLGRQGNTETKKPIPPTPKPNVAEDQALKNKKRAASPTVAATTTKTQTDFNPLALSDEEFSKIANKKFL